MYLYTLDNYTMKKIFTYIKIVFGLLTLCYFGQNVCAQIDTNKPYFDLLRQADSAKKAENYEFAIRYAREALNYGNLYSHLYNLGCSYALNKSADSSFYFIHQSIHHGFKNCSWLTKDSDLEFIRDAEPWDTLMEHCVNKSRYIIDSTLANFLITFKRNEKKYRLQLDSVLNVIGDNNKVTDSLWQIINSIDNSNIIALDSIVDIHGLPDMCKVGYNAAYVTFLIIQHADSLSQSRYFPLLKKSMDQGCTKKSYLAYLSDRILMNRYYYQLFGTQLSWDDSLKYYELIPIIDSVNVDIRRKLYGLQSLKSYLERIR